MKNSKSCDGDVDEMPMKKKKGKKKIAKKADKAMEEKEAYYRGKGFKFE